MESNAAARTTLRTRVASGRRHRRGGALVMALVPLVTVSLMAAAFMQLSTSVNQRLSHSLAVKRSFYLAEAGLNEAMAGLYLGRTGEVGSEDDPAFFGEGFFWVEANEVVPGIVDLECTAVSRGASVTLSRVVERTLFNYASFGFFSDGNLEVKAGALVDGYDSSQGTYADQVAAGETLDAGRLVSNRKVTIEGAVDQPTVLHGKAESGLGQQVQISDEGVSMTVEPGSTEEYMPPPDFYVPNIQGSAKIDHGEPVPLVLPPGEAAYREIKVEDGRELVLRGPARLLVRDMQLGENAKLTFDTSDGPIELFVEGDLDIAAGAIVTGTEDHPRDVKILMGDGRKGGEDGKLSIGVGAEVHGLLFAPHGDVEIKQGAEVFGAIVAGDLKLGEDVRLHFDRALGVQDQRLPRHMGWRIVEFDFAPPEPFLARGLDPNALRMPAEAHEAVWLEIKYRPGAGLAMIEWEGPFDDFDWTMVFDLHHYLVYDQEDGEELLHIHP